MWLKSCYGRRPLTSPSNGRCHQSPTFTLISGQAKMSSFIIQSHVGRQVPLAWAHNDTCAFCRIISGELPAQIVYETEKVIAILGIHLPCFKHYLDKVA